MTDANSGKTVAERPAAETGGRRRFGCLLLAVVLVPGLTVGFVFRSILLRQAGEFLNTGHSLHQPVDGIYVLGGGLETRPFVAAEIYKAGMTKLVLIPSPRQGPTTETLHSVTETDLTYQVLVRLGVPGERIVRLEQPVDSTSGEAAALAEYLSQHRLERIAIVTSDFHTRRAEMLFKRAITRIPVRLDCVSSPTDGFCGSDWWQHEEGVETYLLEWVKLLAHMVFLR